MLKAPILSVSDGIMNRVGSFSIPGIPKWSGVSA